MKTDNQTTTTQAAADFERLYGEREEKLTRLNFADEKDFDYDFDYEDGCPICENKGSYYSCNSCENGSNFVKGEIL